MGISRTGKSSTLRRSENALAIAIRSLAVAFHPNSRSSHGSQSSFCAARASGHDHLRQIAGVAENGAGLLEPLFRKGGRYFHLFISATWLRCFWVEHRVGHRLLALAQVAAIESRWTRMATFIRLKLNWADSAHFMASLLACDASQCDRAGEIVDRHSSRRRQQTFLALGIHIVSPTQAVEL